MYSDIIPKNLQDELIQIGEDITRNTFRIGDIVVIAGEYAALNEIQCSKNDIYRAVGSFIGKASGTVRGYEALAKFYPVSVRKKYEILSSSHFRKAMELDDTYGWEDVLDYAMRRVEDYGRPATVDELTRVFVYDPDEPYEREDEPLEYDRYNPVEKFENTITKLWNMIDLLPVEEYVREDIRGEIERLKMKLEPLFRMKV